jgi:hypothetical protein
MVWFCVKHTDGFALPRFQKCEGFICAYLTRNAFSEVHLWCTLAFSLATNVVVMGLSISFTFWDVFGI